MSSRVRNSFAVLALLALWAAFRAGPLLAETARPEEARTVHIAGGLTDEELLVLSAALAGQDESSLLLLDSEGTAAYLKAFLTAYKPTRVVPVGRFSQDATGLEKRWGVPVAPILRWGEAATQRLWQSLLPQASQVVVCPVEPRRQLLQAAAFAGALRAPLFITHDRPEEITALRGLLDKGTVRQLYRVGAAPRIRVGKGVEAIHLADEAVVAAAYRRALTRTGTIRNLVVTNPTDTSSKSGSLSILGPWLAVRKHAALLLTSPNGKDVAEVVNQSIRASELRRTDTLLLLGDLDAIPVWERPNPVEGDKDEVIEMEPLTPTGSAPARFATGRLFHEDRAVIPLMLARQRLLSVPRGPRRILVASNPGGGLRLLETLSRTTVQELRNAGYETTALFRDEVAGPKLREQLPEHDIFLWEGHQATLIREYKFPEWNEPLPPSLIFLQSCLALVDYKVQPALTHGAVGVIGTSTRMYSASGGACSLAFFDALLYEGQTVGGALRQAKNFLLAYALLKEKRLGDAAVRKGANVRAAWAFTLWGDPTLRLPLPEAQRRQDPIRHEVEGNTIRLKVPVDGRHEVRTQHYFVTAPPNTRMAGLVRKGDDKDSPRSLLPMLFAEVYLPRARPGCTPCLHTRLPSSRWVFCWDEHRRCGYLLALPREIDAGELRFRVEWKPAEENPSRDRKGAVGQAPPAPLRSRLGQSAP
jgi:hypothetical protein